MCLFSFFFSSSEALPFFLLLIDLSRASALAKFALSSNSQVRGLGLFCFVVWMFFLGFNCNVAFEFNVQRWPLSHNGGVVCAR